MGRVAAKCFGGGGGARVPARFCFGNFFGIFKQFFFFGEVEARGFLVGETGARDVCQA